MPDATTPGQIAYEAWWRARWPLDTPPHFTRYSTLTSPDQRAWEAAAQAVLRAWVHNPALFDREDDDA